MTVFAEFSCRIVLVLGYHSIPLEQCIKYAHIFFHPCYYYHLLLACTIAIYIFVLGCMGDTQFHFRIRSSSTTSSFFHHENNEKDLPAYLRVCDSIHHTYLRKVCNNCHHV